MKHILAACALVLVAAGASAADPTPPALAASRNMTPQQQKLGDCATANKGKKGADYKAGVKACMAGASASAPMTSQQKMGACAKANKGKKGDDYKNGVKACMAA